MISHKILVLFGGASSERLVSTASAQNILANLPEASAYFLAKDGSVHFASTEKVLNHLDPFKVEFPLDPLSQPEFKTIEMALSSFAKQKAVIVLAMHGQGAEDGILQRKMEEAKVAFTGSGSQASELAFNKSASKKIAKELGILIAEHREFNGTDGKTLDQTLRSNVQSYKRLAVKPVADGSSVGLYIVDEHSDFVAIADTIAKSGQAYLIEEFISGTELTVGVIDIEGKISVLPPSEVKLQSGSNFDYDAKYLGKGVEELTPARVSADVTLAAQELALKMHQALGCQGYSRTDLIITPRGPVFLETNTLPGMTRSSFLPQQLAVAGKTVREFFQAEIKRAIQQFYQKV